MGEYDGIGVEGNYWLCDEGIVVWGLMGGGCKMGCDG